MNGNEEKAIQSSEARDWKVREAVEILEAGVSQVLTSDGFENYLAFMAKFHRYSARNSLLILLQRPGARRVAGYEKWRELGRQVRRNETGIRILAPKFKKVSGEHDRDGGDGGDGESDAEKKTGGPRKVLVGFRGVKVFDLGQTDPIPGAPPLPAPPELGKVEGGPAAAAVAARLEAGLRSLCAKEGVPVAEEEMEGRDGYYDRARKRIALRTGLADVDRATTLCHEAVHHLLHQEGAAGAENRRERETEAEGAAFAVFSYFGLSTGAFSFPYVAHFAGDMRVLQGALSRISGVARRIIEEAERGEEPEPRDAQTGRAAA